VCDTPTTITTPKNRYLGYRKDQKNDQLPVFTETIMAFFSLVQCVLLGTFAAILGAHRSEILEKQEENASSSRIVGEEDTYETPYART
jgi:hypothetical protein